MLDKIAYDTQNYSDIQGLERMRYAAKNDSKMGMHQVASQFQAYLFQIMLKSMNEANKAISGGLFSSDQMDFYSDLFAKQLSLEMGNKDLGFSALIEKNMQDHFQLPKDESMVSDTDDLKLRLLTDQPKANVRETKLTDILPIIKGTKNPEFKDKQDFVEKIWSYAEDAAKVLKVEPAILIAQAALETNWGKKVINADANQSTHNLFNIKAGANWSEKTATVNALEDRDGVLKQERARFRAYDSFKDSFNDYVKLIKENDRYEGVVTNSRDGVDYLSNLQKAGFATDQHYADKVMQIMNSNSFKSLINNVINKI